MNNHDLILSGIHLELTDALKGIVREKMSRLFKHEERIVRLRVELEHSSNKHKHGEGEFVAKGHIAIHGPDANVSVASDNLYKSIDLLVDKLDRKLRRRSRLLKVKRHHPHDIELPACLPKVSLA